MLPHILPGKTVDCQGAKLQKKSYEKQHQHVKLHIGDYILLSSTHFKYGGLSKLQVKECGSFQDC